MKLGFLTAPFADTSLVDVAVWAASAGFETLEVACWPQAGYAARRYAGTSHIDVANLTEAQAGEIKDEIAAKGLKMLGLDETGLDGMDRKILTAILNHGGGAGTVRLTAREGILQLEASDHGNGVWSLGHLC